MRTRCRCGNRERVRRRHRLDEVNRASGEPRGERACGRETNRVAYNKAVSSGRELSQSGTRGDRNSGVSASLREEGKQRRARGAVGDTRVGTVRLGCPLTNRVDTDAVLALGNRSARVLLDGRGAVEERAFDANLTRGAVRESRALGAANLAHEVRRGSRTVGRDQRSDLVCRRVRRCICGGSSHRVVGVCGTHGLGDRYRTRGRDNCVARLGGRHGEGRGARYRLDEVVDTRLKTRRQRSREGDAVAYNETVRCFGDDASVGSRTRTNGNVVDVDVASLAAEDTVNRGLRGSVAGRSQSLKRNLGHGIDRVHGDTY